MKQQLLALIAIALLSPSPVPAAGLLGQTPESVRFTAVEAEQFDVRSIHTADGIRPVDIQVIRAGGEEYVHPEQISQLFAGSRILRSADGRRTVLVRPDGAHLTVVNGGNGRCFIDWNGRLIDTGFAVHDRNGAPLLPMALLSALFGQRFTLVQQRYEVNPLAQRPQWLDDSWQTLRQQEGMNEYANQISQAAAAPNGQNGHVFSNITATVFSSEETGQRAAYGEYLRPDDLYVALPHRFSGSRPRVAVRANGVTRVAEIKDVGPWNIDDPYWTTGSRPQAESGRDHRGRQTNRAGIDLSPRLGRELGIGGKGTVDWWFVR